MKKALTGRTMVEAWEIYYGISASLVCVDALVAVVYIIVFAITGKAATEKSKLIAGAVWCLTLVLFIVAIILSCINR